MKSWRQVMLMSVSVLIFLVFLSIPVWAIFKAFTSDIFEGAWNGLVFLLVIPIPMFFVAWRLYEYAKTSNREGITESEVKERLGLLFEKLGIYIQIEAVIWMFIVAIFPIIFTQDSPFMFLLQMGGMVFLGVTGVLMYNLGINIQSAVKKEPTVDGGAEEAEALETERE